MKLPGFLDRAIARKFGSFTLDDPRPICAEARYTFFLPHLDEITAVRPGDLVKAIFRPTPNNRYYDAERMWVEVEVVASDGFTGRLVNQPFDIPQARLGTIVTVPRTHVLAVEWAEGREAPAVPEMATYWERCFVDDCVLRGACRVDYLYREDPDPSQDTYPDSGWRLRGSDAAILDDEHQGKAPQYVALGAVLNRDDSWLSLIDAPVGSAFKWDESTGQYRPVVD
jgi:hypothetical protein